MFQVPTQVSNVLILVSVTWACLCQQSLGCAFCRGPTMLPCARFTSMQEQFGPCAEACEMTGAALTDLALFDLCRDSKRCLTWATWAVLHLGSPLCMVTKCSLPQQASGPLPNGPRNGSLGSEALHPLLPPGALRCRLCCPKLRSLHL